MLKISNQTHYHKNMARELVEKVRNYPVDNEVLLQIDDTQLTLSGDINGQKCNFSHSFTTPILHKRASQKKQSLIKACSNKQKTIRSVIDLTAGWGKDGFILAAQGLQVTMIEQNTLIFNCLNYLLNIARKESNEDLFNRLTIHNQNGVDYLLTKTDTAADCLYIDPMFSPHKSSARPAKDLQILQLLTANQSIDELFTLAIKNAGKRVVVKRSLHAPTLNEIKPDIVYRGKTVRFDVYLKN